MTAGAWFIYQAFDARGSKRPWWLGLAPGAVTVPAPYPLPATSAAGRSPTGSTTPTRSDPAGADGVAVTLPVLPTTSAGS
jgi:hypothetical protein